MTTQLTSNRIQLDQPLSEVNGANLRVSPSDRRTIEQALSDAAAQGGTAFIVEPLTVVGSDPGEYVLSQTPSDPDNVVVFVVGGTAQYPVTDFVVELDTLSGFVKKVRWSGLGLEVSDGSQLLFIYSVGVNTTPVTGIGEERIVHDVFVDNAVFTNKYFDLDFAPSNATNVIVHIVGGTTQAPGVDYIITGDDTVPTPILRRLSWNGYDMEDILIENVTRFRIEYSIKGTLLLNATDVTVDTSSFNSFPITLANVQEVLDWIDDNLAGGITLYDTILDWETVDRTGTAENTSLIKKEGIYLYDPTATDLPGVGYLEPSVGGGLGVLEIPHIDEISAAIAADTLQCAPSVTEELDFGIIPGEDISTLNVDYLGAEPGDIVGAVCLQAIDPRLILSSRVDTRGEVSISLYNISANPITPPVDDWNIVLIKPKKNVFYNRKSLRIYYSLLANEYALSSDLENDLSVPENEAAFRLLIENDFRRNVLIADPTIKALIQGSTIADTAMTDVAGAY